MGNDWSALAPAGYGATFWPQLASTNDAARDLPLSGVKGHWAVAGRQQGGRGRMGRTWVSHIGNLYASLAVSVTAESEKHFNFLPFMLASAIRQTVCDLGVNGDLVRCKWPNDVLVDDRKISGVLVEIIDKPGEGRRAIIGIGLNIAHHPSDAQFPATDISQHVSQPPALEDVFRRLALNLDAGLEQLYSHGGDQILDRWRRIAWGMGSRRQINLRDQRFEATLIKLQSDGGLVVKEDDGTEKLLYAGDVFLVPDDG